MTKDRGRWRVSSAVSVVVIACSFSWALGGCAVVRLARGAPGVDLSVLSAGVDRETVEIRLREPMRVWETSKDVVYGWYLYDGGVTPDKAQAFVTAVVDLVAVFVPELALAMHDVDTRGGLRMFHHYDIMAVAYDPNGLVVGWFPGAGEYSALPEDGVPAVAPTPNGR